jgi:DNA adenine methylase
MRPPLYIVKTGGSKCWFIPFALEFLGGWRPKVIVEPFAGSAVVGLSLLNEGLAQMLVIAEKDRDYFAFWRAALGDPNFSYRVATWTKRILNLPFHQQKAFVEAGLEQMKEQDPGFYILLRSRIAYNGKKKGGFMSDRHRGGILGRWPLSLDMSLDLLFSLRHKITLMEDGFDALTEFDNENCYGFIDPPYTLTENCPGHQIYDEAVIDHHKLHSMLANWKGEWQLTYNACGAALSPTGRVTATCVKPDGQEELLWSKKGVLYGVPGIDSDFVQMSSGSGGGGSRKKWEIVMSKRNRPDLKKLAA